MQLILSPFFCKIIINFLVYEFKIDYFASFDLRKS